MKESDIENISEKEEEKEEEKKEEKKEEEKEKKEKKEEEKEEEKKEEEKEEEEKEEEEKKDEEEKEVEKEEEKKEEEKNEPKEDDSLLVRTNTQNLSNYDYRDILLLNDLDFFYKTGKLPTIFFSHLFCTALVTIIILSQNNNLNKLMEHERAMQASFYLHDGTEDPNYDFTKKYY